MTTTNDWLDKKDITLRQHRHTLETSVSMHDYERLATAYKAMREAQRAWAQAYDAYDVLCGTDPAEDGEAWATAHIAHAVALAKAQATSHVAHEMRWITDVKRVLQRQPDPSTND